MTTTMMMKGEQGEQGEQGEYEIADWKNENVQLIVLYR